MSQSAASGSATILLNTAIYLSLIVLISRMSKQKHHVSL